jgi:hypothetical protein
MRHSTKIRRRRALFWRRVIDPKECSPEPATEGGFGSVWRVQAQVGNVLYLRKAARRRKSGCPTKLVAGRTQGRDSPFLACSSDVAIGEDSKPFVTWLLDLQRRERKGHRFRAAAEARGRSSEEPVAKPNAAATRRTLMLAMKSRRMRQYRPITCARSTAPRRTRRRSRASLPPKHIYKPPRGLNDISVLSNRCHGRTLSREKDVIWRMSA